MKIQTRLILKKLLKVLVFVLLSKEIFCSQESLSALNSGKIVGHVDGDFCLDSLREGDAPSLIESREVLFNRRDKSPFDSQEKALVGRFTTLYQRILYASYGSSHIGSFSIQELVLAIERLVFFNKEKSEYRKLDFLNSQFLEILSLKESSCNKVQIFFSVLKDQDVISFEELNSLKKFNSSFQKNLRSKGNNFNQFLSRFERAYSSKLKKVLLEDSV